MTSINNYLHIEAVNQIHCKHTLWNQILPLLEEIEVDYVRREIGEFVIQDNEDLFAELETLVEIYAEYHYKNEQKAILNPLRNNAKSLQMGMHKVQITGTAL
jgi:hypothetical protein